MLVSKTKDLGVQIPPPAQKIEGHLGGNLSGIMYGIMYCIMYGFRIPFFLLGKYKRSSTHTAVRWAKLDTIPRGWE
jgi:hypothetical protein